VSTLCVPNTGCFLLPQQRAGDVLATTRIHMRNPFLRLIIGLLAGVGSQVGAQSPTPILEVVEQPFDFYATGSFRGAVPRPEVLLGYEPGAAYADYGAFMRVLDTYAEQAADRMRVIPTGLTFEHRPMHVLAISSPANLARLDEIRTANQRLADGRSPLNAAALDRFIAQQPIIVWLGYNIHGDEAAGTEAAMRVLYALLDRNDPEMTALLDEVVVIMNPCQNPDGRERFVTWSNAHDIGRPEAFSFVKENPWNVQGRYNHYYFDLNRDMIATSQLESRHTGAAFLDWLPQVAADHHGETKEYFFPPAMLPINPNLPRESTERWLDTFGRGNGAAFDAQGWMYYVRDYFDIFYAGYWDSWPALQGATGMTYETSGGGKNGRNYRRDDGTIMTLRAAIAKHYTASLATIATAAANRLDRLRDFHAHFTSAVTAGRDPGLQQVFLPPGGDPAARDRLLGMLTRSGVEVRELNQAVTVASAHDYLGSQAAERDLPAGTWVVDLAQPKGRVARAFLEPHAAMDEAFIERQQRKAEINRERGDNAREDDLEFYDITAWTLPLMAGVEAYWTEAAVDLGGAPLQVPAPVTPTVVPVATSAYVVPAGTLAAQHVALDLLASGYRVATSVRPLVAGGETFPRGSFIVRVERNPASLHARINTLAAAHGATIAAVNSAFADHGNTGIGSEATFALKAPKVLVTAGEATSPSSYGALHYLFEQDFGLEFVPVDAGSLAYVPLADFNVVVLTSGSPSRYADDLGEAGLARLKAWVEEGGTLICLGGATELALDEDTAWTSVRPVGEDSADEAEEAPADDAEVNEAVPDPEPLPVPGALLRTRIDHEHFLTFGYPQDELALLVNTDTFFTASDTGTNVLTFAEEGDLWLSGYLWPDNTERLIAGTAAVVDEPMGHGHLILFTDEPGYRALWQGTTRMLFNAILYGPGLQNETGSYLR